MRPTSLLFAITVAVASSGCFDAGGDAQLHDDEVGNGADPPWIAEGAADLENAGAEARGYVRKVTVEGWIACGARGPTFAMNCPVDDPNLARQLIFETEPGLKTIAVAMDWDPNNSLSLSRYLSHVLFTNLTNDQIFGTNYVFSDTRVLPGLQYRVDATPNDPYLDWDSRDDGVPIEFRIGAGRGEGPDEANGGLNVIVQQRFTLHYDLFFIDHAPDGYSALPPPD